MTSLRGNVWAVCRFAFWPVVAAAFPRVGFTQSVNSHIAPVVCESGINAVAPQITWRGDVVQFAEWPVQFSTAAVKARVMIVKMPANRIEFSLMVNRVGNLMAPWSIEHAPNDAVIAVNAGQFTDNGPWGWVVHNRRELQPPGTGALAGALVVDRNGAVQLLTAGEIATWRTPLRAIEAVQSYPMLLDDNGRPPPALCSTASGLDLSHRDTRLAIGITRGDEVLLVLTQFEAPGGIATRIPIGPTTPEMAEIMRRLGAVRALMLDGGLSAQMMVRSAADSARWPGLRGVPLALIGRLRK